jgi:hypothetical protein
MGIAARQRTAGLRDAALGVGMSVAAVLASSTANSADVEKAAATVPPRPAATLDEKACRAADGNAGDIVDHYTKNRKEPPSPTLLNSMADWLEAKCPAPFEVQWENGDDRVIFTGIRSQLLGLKRPVDLEAVGVKLAPQRTVPRPPKPVASAARQG